MGLKNNIFLNHEQLAVALRNPSSWILITVNLGLILAVIFWQWSVFDIVFLYWVENLVIGAINVLKMLVCSPSLTAITSDTNTDEFAAAAEKAGINKQHMHKFDRWLPVIANWGAKLFFIPFFIIHYGMFCYAHGIFVFALFSGGTLSSENLDQHAALSMLNPNMRWAIALLAVSHLYSFFRNYVAEGEYKQTNPAALMMRPYGRIVVLHITILMGGMLAMALGDPIGLLIVMIVLKTAVDLAMHQAERNKYQRV